MPDDDSKLLEVTAEGQEDVADRSRRRRLRTIGVLILAIGVVSAVVTYWLETRNAGPSMEDLLPGSEAADARQMGILYGPTFAMILGWMNDLQTPAGHALLIVVISAVVAALCLHIARLPDADFRSLSDKKLLGQDLTK